MARRVLLFALVLTVSACGPAVTQPGLANKGITAVAADNAYLGSNLYLAQEMERSPTLHNFIAGRGGPQAMQLIEHNPEHRELLLYYTAQGQVFVGTKRDGEEGHDWVIRGPFPLSRQDFRVIRGVVTGQAEEPVFLISGEETRFGTQRGHGSTEHMIVTAQIPKPLPTPKPKPKWKPKVVAKTGIEPSDRGTTKNDHPIAAATPLFDSTKPLNTDQMAIAMAKGFAERTSGGDLIHTVKSDLETFDGIVQWYTRDPAYKPEIAKLNLMDPTQPLKPGARIRIPAALVKNNKTFAPDSTH